MGDRFRQLIEAELAEEVPPPLGDVLHDAMRDGRRMRRVRAMRAGLAGVAAVAILALGLGAAVATGIPDGQGGAAQVGAAPDAVTSPPAPAPAVTTGPPGEPEAQRPAGPVPMIGLPLARAPGVSDKPGGAPARTEPSAVLVMLLDLLPPGRTIEHAGGTYADYTGVQVLIDRGDGYGMIRFAVAEFLAKSVLDCPDSTPAVTVACHWEGGALIETFEIEANCVQRRGVNVLRPDGLAIQINISDCPARNGAPFPTVQQALSIEEAIWIALDPVWTMRNLDNATKRAAEAYPRLPPLADFAGVRG